MPVTITESGRLRKQIRIARKNTYYLRPLFVVSLYIIFFAALEWQSIAFRISSTHASWYLTAGLNFGLLAAYGWRYVPAVAIALLGANFWLHPLPGGFTHDIGIALIMTLIYLGGAAVVRHKILGQFPNLKYRNELARLMLVGAVISLLLGTCVAANLNQIDDLDIAALLPVFLEASIGNAIGLLLFTPFLILHGIPRIEAWLQRVSGTANMTRDSSTSLWMHKPFLLASMVFLSLAAIVIWTIFGLGIRDELSIFFLFSLPIILISLRRGIEGSTATILVMIGAVMYLLWMQKAGSEETYAFQILLLTASLNGLLVGSSVSEMKNTEIQMVRRDTILQAVSFAAESFLGKAAWESGTHEVLARLGQISTVSRVFIVDKRFIEQSKEAAQLPLNEWTASWLSNDVDDSKVLNLMRKQLIEDHDLILCQSQPCVVRAKNLPLKKREILEALDIHSVALIPIFVEKSWWGCLGLEQCFVEREWPDSELEGLKMAGQVLGTLIASMRVEQQFRQLTGNVQAVFWISSIDGESKHYVSPAYEEIWGRSCVSIMRESKSWLDGIHPEDLPRVREALVRQVWGEYDEEFRIIRPDGSIRWVRDRAFPVRDQAGQVYRIVGLAEDITKHKKVENRLRSTMALLSLLIDNLPTGILVEDESRHITHVNQAFKSMFGLQVPTDSLFGIDSRIFSSHPETFGPRIEEIIEEGTPVRSEELHLKNHILQRSYISLSTGEDYRYHLWQYIDITESRRAEKQIRASLKEKEILLKEIHHRVKNNLQIISSLLNLQSHKISDPYALQTFKESQDRVRAMALIHERLYQTGDFAKIDFAGYVRSFTNQLLRSYKVNTKRIRLHLDVDPVSMNLELAIPCALIIHELVTNSLKYAFKDDRSGQIWVRLTEENNQMLNLTVRDDGIGVPEGINFDNSQSLGMKLVGNLTSQLNGSIRYINGDGFQCQIRIPCATPPENQNRKRFNNAEENPANTHS